MRFQKPRENPAEKIGSRISARQLAFEVLRERERGGAFTEELLEAKLARVRLAPLDRALCQELVLGAVRWQAALDWLVTRNTGGRPQLPLVQILLRLGLYQLCFLDRIPPHAAVDETVELAKWNDCDAQAGFINGVLRTHARELGPTRHALAELKSTQPHTGWSHPEWLVKRWLARWGAEPVARLLEWNNTPPATFARVNTLRTDAARLLEQWRMEGVQYDFVRREGLRENSIFLLKSHPPLATLESFITGGFYVQDPSTLAAVGELLPQSGDAILDLCAAPGGKTTAIAARMNNSGRIVAVDTGADRLKRLGENCRRLGVTCVEAVAAPFPQAGTTAAVRFDRALVDAPCSNTGVLRRRVDVRWRLREGDLGRHARTQLELLARAAGQLKRGGVLVYSTCSVEPEENGGVVKDFLAAHREFTLEHERELLPFRDAMDGGYVARLKRA